MENAAYLVRFWFWVLPPFFMDRLSFVDECAHFLYVIAIFALLLVFGGPVLCRQVDGLILGSLKFSPRNIKMDNHDHGSQYSGPIKVGGMQDSLSGIAKVGLCFSLPMFLIFFNQT